MVEKGDIGIGRRKSGSDLGDVELGRSNLGRLVAFLGCQEELRLGVGEIEIELFGHVGGVQRSSGGTAADYCHEHDHKLREEER